MLNGNIIVGAMLVSQCAELLDITIPNLLKWCDWILIVMDNESEEVRNKVYEYQKKYYHNIFVRRSSVPTEIMTKNGNILNYHKRWKAVKGIVRNDVLQNLRSILLLQQKGYEKIDILLWADHDVIFTNYLPELLDRFITSDKKAISLKHITVVNDMFSVMDDSIGSHVHILKWNNELSGLPRRFYALYYPLERKDIMYEKYYSVHLAYLTKNNREWRNNNWKTSDINNRKIYKFQKSVENLRPEEIKI